MGYNIYKGSPYAKQDEGWSSGQLFEFDWGEGNIKIDSANRSYPYDVNIQQVSMCSTDMTITTQSSSKALQSSFSASVSVSASYSTLGFSASFTGSYSYASTSSTYSSSKMSTGVAQAKCALFKASLKRVELPCFS